MDFIKKHGINGNALKIIATLTMLIDHIGYIFFPEIDLLRIIGRISFPIFAFMIAEGCEYTKNKLRYFLTIFLLGAFCQLVYFIVDGRTYLEILITFSLSIVAIYALQNLKRSIVAKKNIVISSLLFITVIGAIYVLNVFAHVDYHFFGCMAPLFASIFRKPKLSNSKIWQKLDNNLLHVIMLAICLVFVWLSSGQKQIYALLAIPILLLYSGKKGKLNLKYFFYIFYPVHLAVLQGIAFLLY